MTEVKVSFYLKRNEEKADGTVPVLGRIRIGKSMVQFSAKVSVPVSLWDTQSGSQMVGHRGIRLFPENPFFFC